MPDATALQFAPPEPQRDAADRLSRLHGALELKAALLALILPAASQRATRAFEIETEGSRQAPGILVHVRNLPPAARLPWLDELLRRMALQSLPLRQELLQSTRRVMGARGYARPIDRLHWLAMRRGLGEKAVATPRAGNLSEWLDADILAVASYSAFLSRMVPVERPEGGDDGPGLAWYQHVMEQWHGSIEVPPCNPPDGEGVVRALGALQTLTPVQRPMPVRAWGMAAARLGPQRRISDSAADALRLTCLLLDTPTPPEVERHFANATAIPKAA